MQQHSDRSVQRAGLFHEKQGSRGRHAGQAPSRRAACIEFSSTAACRPLAVLEQLQATPPCPLNSCRSACHRPPSQQLSTHLVAAGCKGREGQRLGTHNADVLHGSR